MKIVVLQHDADDGPERLGDWLVEAGAELQIIRADLGEQIPTDTSGFDGLISLGGAMGAWDDEVAPWLPATRALLAAARNNFSRCDRPQPATICGYRRDGGRWSPHNERTFPQ